MPLPALVNAGRRVQIDGATSCVSYLFRAKAAAPILSEEFPCERRDGLVGSLCEARDQVVEEHRYAEEE
jgi:hypothetical protein